MRLVVAVALAASTAVLGTAATSAAHARDHGSDGWSMKSATEILGATDYWDAGFTGAGIDVAIIDTGVAPVPGLDAPGKVIHGPDLSFESQNPALARLDTNGHGTFMAGLIAGHDATLTWPYSRAPEAAYRGVAPDARIVSVKVGVADGGVDVTQVIAAIDWVVDHRQDNGLNIRVLNISFGTGSSQPAAIDPLAQAAERAWRAGIVVVAAGGNRVGSGRGSRGLSSPAYSPMVLAVGALDTNGTAGTRDDSVPSYSAEAAPHGRAVNLVAVGTKMQGLRVPNSYVDLNFPNGRLGERFFRGSGTSEAAAIASGAAALLLQQHPELTPDQVVEMLERAARPVGRERASVQGHGALDLGGVLRARVPRARSLPADPFCGVGSVEASRGGVHVANGGVALTGELDIFGRPFRRGSACDPWTGGTWHGSVWAGDTWAGPDWALTTWSGSTWSGSSWSGSTWSGSSWSGSSWSGSTWSGSSWSGSSWSGSSWSGSSWSSDVWSTEHWG
ncbi:MAG: S8 family serine peptidase [Ilumatobacter sp.]|nr:S8 family serine peptidase [Ilumatobacter sp.]